jgi:hypothetical protein
MVGWGRVAMPNESPQNRRRGWLKYGNPPGDFTRAARCGAKTRREFGSLSESRMRRPQLYLAIRRINGRRTLWLYYC